MRVDNVFFHTFSGHKSAVTSLVFDESSTRLVSGSKVSKLWFITGIEAVQRFSLPILVYWFNVSLKTVLLAVVMTLI